MARTTIRPALLVILSLAGAALGPATPVPTVWTVIAIDPQGDGREPSSWADAAQLSYRYDHERDMLWFRLGLFDKPNAGAFSVAIAVDTGARDIGRTHWSGANKEFTFDRLVTAHVTRGDGRYTGTIGISDAVGSPATHPTNVRTDDLHIAVDGSAVVLGFKRTDLTDKKTMNLIAAIGLDQEWNDEIPNSRSAAIDLAAPRPSRGIREIDVSRNNFQFAPGEKTLADAATPRVVRRGHGGPSLILIPGVYSGDTAFDGFMARRDSAYTFFVLTPPGLNGTPARTLPTEDISYGSFTWTRHLAHDILDLIERERLDRPIVVAHGFPGSLAAEELALTHPQRLGGIIEIASMPVQSFPSMQDPRRQATPGERIAIVDKSWAQQWFKYVTPETWESNNYPADMLANDPERGERARKQLEAAPLPVKIRYLVEFMASDHRADFGRFSVPMLALKPGFNETVLANPAFGWFKVLFHDSWSAVSPNPLLEQTTIADARALMLDDQPEATDRAIATFVQGRVR